MKRAISVPNKIIAKKTRERKEQLHEKKMKEITCSIDQEMPASFGSLRNNRKRQQLKENRNLEIERENRILLERLTHIMNHPLTTSQKEFRIKSLNREQRKRELVRITIENQWMIKRISEQKSSYSRAEWSESRKKQEYYLKTMSQYPFKPSSPSRSQYKSQFSDVKFL